MLVNRENYVSFRGIVSKIYHMKLEISANHRNIDFGQNKRESAMKIYYICSFIDTNLRSDALWYSPVVAAVVGIASIFASDYASKRYSLVDCVALLSALLLRRW